MKLLEVMGVVLITHSCFSGAGYTNAGGSWSCLSGVRVAWPQGQGGGDCGCV